MQPTTWNRCSTRASTLPKCSVVPLVSQRRCCAVSQPPQHAANAFKHQVQVLWAVRAGRAGRSQLWCLAARAMGKGKKRGQEEAGAMSTAPAKVPATGAGTAAGGALGGLQHYMCHLQVLASDVEHNSPSLMLVVDKGGRYMFNAGEGLQRLMREKKVRMNKLENYLFTRVCSETMAGLPGMLLSTSIPSADAGGLLKGQDVCNIIGPPGVQAYVHAFKEYVNNEQRLEVTELPCAAASLTPAAAAAADGGNEVAPGTGFKVLDAVVRNDFMEIIPVTLSPGTCTSSGSQQQGNGPEAMDVDGAQVDAWNPPQDAACYVCELRGLPGKFDPKRADALDVPRGKERGDLQRGQSVTLLTGRVVHSHEVMAPGVPGPCLVVVDCPTESHLDILASQAGPLTKWTDEAKADAGPATAEVENPLTKHRVMAHFTPLALLASPRYQQWLHSLGPAWQHVVCYAGAGQKTTLMRASVLQAKLHALHPGLFPSLHPPWHPGSEAAVLLPDATTPRPPPPSQSSVSIAPPQASNGTAQQSQAEQSQATASTSGALGGLVLAPNACRYQLLPLRIQGVDSADVSQDFCEAQVCEQFEAVASEVIKMARDAAAPTPAGTDDVDELPQALRGIGRDELEVVFLGTVSSVPSKFRNVTAIYLDRFHRGGLLLDCGEDTLGQLKRRYGAADTERRVLELGMVWVSHMHADHHGGLARLLTLRHQLVEKRRAQLQQERGAEGQDGDAEGKEADLLRPLLVVGPSALFRVLANFREVLRMPFHFLPNHCLEPDFDGRAPPPMVLRQYQAVLDRLELKAVAPFPVLHVGRAYGIRVEGQAGWKVVFSGDTRPASSLVQAAKGATLLIHEATFEDEKADEALAKSHSTTGEAMRMATQSGAYRTILTHFSTRYPTIPAFDGDARRDIGIAMDFMTVNLLDLPWIPKMVGPLDVLFKREEAGWEADEAEGPAAAITSAPAAGGEGKTGGAGKQDKQGSKQGGGDQGNDKKAKQQKGGAKGAK